MNFIKQKVWAYGHDHGTKEYNTMLSEEQMDALIDANRESLKRAMRELLAGKLAVAFTFENGAGGESGQMRKVRVILTHELCAVVLEAAARGVEQSNHLYFKSLEASSIAL